ncbi:MAG: hypothetical protein ACPGID_08415 [Rubricella sp.]
MSKTETPLWLDDLSPGGTGQGFYEKGLRHSFLHVRRARPQLLVTFDNLSNVGDRSMGRLPWAYKFAADNHLNYLGVYAHVANWYRAPELIARLERLRDDGFFEGYERVVFTGSSMGAFAALVFSGLAPGAHVLAFNPQTTLDPGKVPWEERFANGRRQDWTLPYSDAAGALGSAARVSVFYDPYFAPDHKHYQRIEGPNVTPFRCWFSNHKSAVFLRKIGGLKPVMEAGVFGEIDPAAFYRAYRERRRLPWYRGSLTAYFEKRGRVAMGQRATQAFRRNLRLQREAEGAAAPEAAE